MRREFMEQFDFRPEGGGLVGIERESLLLDGHSKIAPLAPSVLTYLGGPNGRFGYELSACQLEDRIGPVLIDDVVRALEDNDAIIRRAELALGFTRAPFEVASVDMPLDIYPDPSGRYQALIENMPHEILSAACRVVGTHVHIGMPDPQVALRVYRKVRRHWKKLAKMGDNSNGERLRLYRLMAPELEPPDYDSWTAYCDEAEAKDFLHDPRKCWHIIRLSVHGTIEFRMFGITRDVNRVASWATACYTLCQQALEG